ncbi:MAG: hypothetical protein B6D61_11465 [Bacteroidetes bacterium 4484_249]|nr:MAG: hypothetical protein B6D61_11465 [Bacteroidetes bacterium 4484_249]
MIGQLRATQPLTDLLQPLTDLIWMLEKLLIIFVVNLVYHNKFFTKIELCLIIYLYPKLFQNVQTQKPAWL